MWICFLFLTLLNAILTMFPCSFIAGVLDIKVMGCLGTDKCNKTTLVEFLSNRTLYSMKKSCCDKDFCNAGPALQFSLAPLSLTILIIAQMVGLF